jgi:flagellar hook-length control protein FliK
MPVTLNPPPFPTPDNATAIASDKAQDGHAAPRDAFAALLLAAGDPANDAGNDVTSAMLPLDPNDTAADTLRSLRAALQGGNDRPPVISLPVVGRDPAFAGQAAKADASADAGATSKTDDDKPDADILAASDLAGMTAALNALLAAGTPSGTVATRTATAGSQAKADSNSNAIATTTADAAVARRDVLQADLRAAADARAAAQPAAGTSSALQAAIAVTGGNEPTTSTKSAPVAAAGVDATSSQSQMAALQHNFSVAVTPQITIATPVTSPTWQHEFADKLGQVVMTGADRADFRIHPAEMGPVNVSISVSADQASVVITAAHAATREALEQALPQLRDLLAGQGITLGQASVQSENRPQQQSTPSRDFASSLDDSATVEIPLRLVRLNGLVDVFA